MQLKIVSPEGAEQNFSCDSVQLWMAPDSDGKGEGSIGIRKGHTEAVIALGNGPLTAYLDGKEVYKARTTGGFTTVLNDTVTVVTPHLKLIENVTNFGK